MTDEIDGIIAKMTKAQREASNWRGAEWWHCDGRVTRGLHSKGLIEQPNYRGTACFTPLGLRVRARLSGSDLSNG